MVKDRVFEALKRGEPMSTPQVAAEVGCGEATARAAIHELHKQRYIHIKAWERNSNFGCPYAIWVWGYGEDAPRPARKREAEPLVMAESESYRTIARLRETCLDAGPFRVLMAQVAA